MTLYIRTQTGRQYHIDEHSYIIRLDQPGFRPSGQWRMIGIRHVRMRRLCMTTSQVRRAYYPSTVWPTEKPALLYKNGKPQWQLVDYDHGSYRTWGDGIVAIERVE